MARTKMSGWGTKPTPKRRGCAVKGTKASVAKANAKSVAKHGTKHYALSPNGYVTPTAAAMKWILG